MGEADKAAATRARLLAYHSRNNSMGLFYMLYQDERPPSPRSALEATVQRLGPTQPDRGQERTKEMDRSDDRDH